MDMKMPMKVALELEVEVGEELSRSGWKSELDIMAIPALLMPRSAGKITQAGRLQSFSTLTSVRTWTGAPPGPQVRGQKPLQAHRRWNVDRSPSRPTDAGMWIEAPSGPQTLECGQEPLQAHRC